jgi:hypothetical protein
MKALKMVLIFSLWSFLSYRAGNNRVMEWYPKIQRNPIEG